MYFISSPKERGFHMIRKADRQKTGMVFNIRKFSVNDGPGIRTVVFFKGRTHPYRFFQICRNTDRLEYVYERP